MNERWASSMPAATHRFFISPPVQCFTLCMVVRATEIIDSMALVPGQHVGQVAADAEAPDGEHVLQALEQAGSGVGVLGTQLAGQPLGGVQAFPRVGVGEDEPQAGIDLVAELLGQVPFDISPLMQIMEIST